MTTLYLKDVAKAAGVSVSAASHAINRSGNLKAETRAHILKVAEELGYQRNPALSAIAARRFRSDAAERFARVEVLQLCEAHHPRLTRPDAELLPLLQARGPRFGFQVGGWTQITDAEQTRRQVERWRRQGVDVLLITDSDRMDWLEGLDLSSFVIMGLEDLPAEFPFDRVERDWGHAVRVCYQRLWQAGCRRIGGLIQPEGGELTHQDRIRLGAFYAEWRRWGGVEGPEPPLLSFSLDQKTLKRDLPKALRARNWDGLVTWLLRPLYVLQTHKSPALRTIRGSLIRYLADDKWYKPFPGVSLPRETLAEETLRLLYDALIHGRKGIPDYPHVHRIQGKWVDAGA